MSTKISRRFSQTRGEHPKCQSKGCCKDGGKEIHLLSKLILHHSSLGFCSIGFMFSFLIWFGFIFVFLSFFFWTTLRSLRVRLWHYLLCCGVLFYVLCVFFFFCVVLCFFVYLSWLECMHISGFFFSSLRQELLDFLCVDCVIFTCSSLSLLIESAFVVGVVLYSVASQNVQLENATGKRNNSPENSKQTWISTLRCAVFCSVLQTWVAM